MTASAPPTPRPSLAELRERARALEAERTDIDALLVAMGEPLAPEEDARARADVLHRLIDDPVLGGMRGGDQRRVDETAVHALLALGEPYASELSEDGQKLLQRTRTEPPEPAVGKAANERAPAAEEDAFEGAGSAVIGLLAMIWSVVEVLHPVFEYGTRLVSRGPEFLLLFVLSAGLTLFAPGLLLWRRELGSVSRVVFVVLALLVFLAQSTMGYLTAAFVRSGTWTSTPDGRFALVALTGALLRAVLVLTLIFQDIPPEPPEPTEPQQPE